MNSTNSNLTAGFIDLATYDELEKYMYGGPDATAYFVRETRKSTWFTQCPVSLARCNGTPEFGSEWSCSISRAGDYLLGTWLHIQTPEVSLKCATAAANSVCIAWTPNFMHALVKECSISFNDLVAARFDSAHLDFWSAFTTPASKAEGYKKMIGANLPTHGNYIPAYNLNLPLPFFFTRDSGVALPTAALPYNEMRINFTFRNWQELLLTFREHGNCPNASDYGPAMALNDTTGVVSKTNYAAPHFCKRNCPVVSVAADQLSNANELEIPSIVRFDVGTSTTITTDSAHGLTTGDEILITGVKGWNNGASQSPATDALFNKEHIVTFVSPTTFTINVDTSATGLTAPDGNSGTNKGTIIQQSGHSGTAPSNMFNDQYAHMNYDAEVCSKCLLMGGQDTGQFTLPLVKTPSLGANKVQVWANYAIVSNEERKRMACAPRDILIEQVQCASSSRFGGQNPFPSNASAHVQPQHYDIRFSHAVKVLFFGAKNTTFKTVHSNYSTGVPCLSKQNCGSVLNVQSLSGQGYGGKGGDQLLYALGLTNGPSEGSPDVKPAASSGTSKINLHPVCDSVSVTTNIVGCANATDPMATANLVYENTSRLGLMANDYYSQVQPYYHAPSIPDDKNSPVFCAAGYHMYSYSLDFICLDPLGSTNYGKLTNVAINAAPSKNWGGCVSNEALQVLYDTNGNNVPNNFGGGSHPGIANLEEAKNQCAGALKYYDRAAANLVSFSIEDLMMFDASNQQKVTGGYGLIDSAKNTQKFSFQFVCTAVNNNIVRISGGALGFPVL